MGAIIRMADHTPRPRKRRHNDPLDSPLVRLTRKMVSSHLKRMADAHLETPSTEVALQTGGYLQGAADVMKMLEWVAVELAKKASP